MHLLGAVRQRAKWIEAEANALVAEHGKDAAYALACDMKRQANDLEQNPIILYRSDSRRI